MRIDPVESPGVRRDQIREAAGRHGLRFDTELVPDPADDPVDRIRDELGVEAQTVATGGLADLIAPHARTLDRIDPHLTLEGLRIVWSRNQ